MSRKVALTFGLIAASFFAIGCGSTNASDAATSTSTGTTGLSGNGIGANGNSGSSGSSGTHASTSGSTGRATAATIGSTVASTSAAATSTTGSTGTMTTPHGTTGTTGTTGGPPQCNIGCSSDSICQSDCAEAPTGSQNCCDTSGVCYLASTPTCPGMQAASSGSSTGTFY